MTSHENSLVLCLDLMFVCGWPSDGFRFEDFGYFSHKIGIK